VGVEVEISFVVVIHEQVSCIYADFKVFSVFRPPYLISGMCQIMFRMRRRVANSYSGKVAKAHHLIPSGLEMAAKWWSVVWFHPPPPTSPYAG